MKSNNTGFKIMQIPCVLADDCFYIVRSFWNTQKCNYKNIYEKMCFLVANILLMAIQIIMNNYSFVVTQENTLYCIFLCFVLC